jgi:hypothetical protein
MATVAFAMPSDPNFMDWESFKTTGTIPHETSRETIQAVLAAARAEFEGMFPDMDQTNDWEEETPPEWSHFEDSLKTGYFVKGVFIGPGEPSALIERADAIEPTEDDNDDDVVGSIKNEKKRKWSSAFGDETETEDNLDFECCETPSKYYRTIREDDITREEFDRWLNERPEYRDATQEQRWSDDDFIAALEKNGNPYTEIKFELENEWSNMFDDVMESSIERLGEISLEKSSGPDETEMTQEEFCDWLENHPTHRGDITTRMRDLEYVEQAERDGSISYADMKRRILKDWDIESQNLEKADELKPHEFWKWFDNHPFHRDAEEETRKGDIEFVNDLVEKAIFDDTMEYKDVQKTVLERWSAEAQKHYEPPSPQEPGIGFSVLGPWETAPASSSI